MQRSSSAPILSPHISFQPAAGDSLSRSDQNARKIALRKQSRSHVQLSSVFAPASPVHTPIHDREDPFGAASFFPTNPAAPADQDSWSWLREDSLERNADDRSGYAYAEAGGSLRLDDDAHLIIEKEDKMGVLSLDMNAILVQSASADENDLGLTSAYSDEGPLSDDGLYEAMRARRRASMYDAKTAKVAPSPGTLFGPEEEEGEEGGDKMGLMYEGLRKMVGRFQTAIE